MKTILCYGDSNTWGYDPVNRQRFGPDVRWTGVLAATLGPDYRVIEEGLNGRTTNLDDPVTPDRNGRRYLLPCLESQMPLDLVIIMLGTNDLKERFGRSASDIAESATGLAALARTPGFGPADGSAQVLLIAPPPVANLTAFAQMFAGADAKSRDFAQYYGTFAAWNNIPFLDAGSIIRSSDLDGIHFEASDHRKLGEAIANEGRKLVE